MRSIILSLCVLPALLSSAACTSDAPGPDEAEVGGYVDVDGLPMYYEIHGEGEPLVLLHGGLQTIDVAFAGLLPLLAQDRRVIAIEQQGHGHTADVDRPLTYAQMADDTAALLRHLGVARADVFGFSMGGGVALHLGMRHPGQVDRLIVASAGYDNAGLRPELQAIMDDPTAPLPADTDWLPTPAEFAEMAAAYQRVAPDPADWPVISAKASRLTAEFEGIDPARLRDIAAPTLIVVGDNDFITVEHAAEMTDLLPDADLAVLPGTTHTQVTTAVDRLLPALTAFLDAR